MTIMTATMSTPALGAEGPSTYSAPSLDLLTAIAVPGRYALSLMGLIASVLTVRSDLDRLAHMDERQLRDIAVSASDVQRIALLGL